MISSGNKDLDNLIGGYDKEVTFIYGPAASGKTTLALVTAIKQLDMDKKVVFIDTENGFSIDRFMQLCGTNYLYYLDKLLLIKVNNFQEQCEKVSILINLVSADLIIVDSLGAYYRKEVRDNHVEINKKMERQLKILTELSRRGIPILITNQVSTHPDSGEIKMVGGEMVKKWGKKLIELKKDPRKIVLRKPDEKENKFEITNEGIMLLSS